MNKYTLLMLKQESKIINSKTSTSTLCCILLLIFMTSCKEIENKDTIIYDDSGKEKELVLVWSDEFNEGSTISSSNWNSETVPPDHQINWWNGEKQHYTNRDDNLYISDGTLKIVAKKEQFNFVNSRNENIIKEYTSARINTQDKFEFYQGRIDVRAKLPKGNGTWPAIWMLGANIGEAGIGWPRCGEIDIMEHWGYNPGVVASATHTKSCSGDCDHVTVGKSTLLDYSDEFHVYSVEWDSDELRFLIDGEFRYSYQPKTKTEENWPFTKNQFIILNVAMGGHWFEIDPDFKMSAMEVDYVRVYQKNKNL